MKKKEVKNRQLLKMYFKTVFFSVLILTALFWLIGKSVVLMSSEKATGPSNTFYDNLGDNVTNVDEKEETTLLKAPKKTNFLLVGVDKHELLTDVIMVGSFDSDSQVIDLISIPRDTYIEYSTQEKAKAKAAGIYLPSSGQINVIHSYTSKEFGVSFLEEHIENMLGIQIDYYAKVNIQSFRDLVDAVDGVEFNVPIRMKYDDPYQNLHIDLQAGYQTLNGEQAEQLVRYRKGNSENEGYARADLQRIEVQQDFMKALFKKVLSLDGIVSNPIDTVKVYLDNVETNFSIVDMPKYVKYIPNLSINKMNTYSIPYNIESDTINRTEALELVNTVFYSDRLSNDESAQLIYSKSIQVLNGSRTNGLASDTADKLTELEFNVADVGNYSGDWRNETVIKVKQGTNASELQKLFDNCVVEYTLRSSEAYDVVIVLGLEEEGIEN